MNSHTVVKKVKQHYMSFKTKFTAYAANTLYSKPFQN
jgi:hypothetical protein